VRSSKQRKAPIGCIISVRLIRDLNCLSGHAVAHLVEVMRYKPEGRGFDSRWCDWNLTLASTQPLREMSTSSISWGVNAAGAYG
jgi:hypothetical protein